MKKKARFFCENCQTEVKGNARFCGHCGRFFAAVKCPACGKTGASHAFANGCPQCGYAVSNSSSTETSKSILNDKKSVLKTNSKKNFNLKKLFSKSNNNQEKNYSEDSLPLWIYLVAIIFLVVILIMFSKMI